MGELGKRGEGEKTMQKRTRLPLAASLMAAIKAATHRGRYFADSNQTKANALNAPGLIG